MCAAIPKGDSGRLDAGRATRVQRIFEEARKLSPEKRSAFLTEACGDTETRAEVETLLRHYALTGRSFLPAHDDSATVATRSAALVGESGLPKLPDHDVVKQIGGGGFGDVYLAKNRHDRQFYAVKVVRSGTDCELQGLRRFKACVAEHHSLIPIQHVGRVGNVIYYVMPLADHALGDWPIYEPVDYVPMTLSRRVRRTVALPAQEVAEICEAIASGLSHMHANGAVHGDVKPGNVFLIGGHWRLGDYGLVSDADTRDPRGATPLFVPPDGPGTREADAFALGMTGLQLLSGHAAGGSRALLAKLRQGDRSVDDGHLIDICARLVEPLPTRRCTVNEAAQSLAQLTGGACSSLGSNPMAARRRRGKPRTNRRSLVVAACATALVAVGAWAIAYMGMGPNGGGGGSLDPSRVSITSMQLNPYRTGDRPSVDMQPLAPVTVAASPLIEGDWLEVEAELTAPGYYLMIGIKPDGSTEQWLPANGIPVPAARIAPGNDPAWQLNNGPGLHAFILLASDQRLPQEVWRPALEDLRWSSNGIEGVWRFDGLRIRFAGGERSPGRRPGVPQPLEELAERLRTIPGVDAVEAIAFPVMPAAVQGSTDESTVGQDSKGE